jgi:uncharacterized membrane protein
MLAGSQLPLQRNGSGGGLDPLRSEDANGELHAFRSVPRPKTVDRLAMPARFPPGDRLKMSQAPVASSIDTRSYGDAATRIGAIDILRGLVMILMALDHTREYFHAAPPGLDATDPVNSTLILYGTRWVTYFCAPTFVFLTGVSAWLRGRSKDNPAALSRFLATRGLWLVLLELTIVGTGFSFHPGYLFLQVIWVIGIGCIVLACLCRLPATTVLALGLGLVLGHELLGFGPIRPEGAAILHSLANGRFAFIDAGPVHGLLLYSLIGWVGLVLAGYGMGPIFAAPAERRRIILTATGAAMIVGFLLLRLLNGYGNPEPWSQQSSASATFMAFMRVSKYPPSVDYDLITLGPVFLLLPWLETASGRFAAILSTYGRVPLFYYILHIYLIHGCAAMAGMAQGIPFSRFTNPLDPPASFGVPLAGVYLLWALFVASLYLPCRWFNRLRQRRSDWWLSYL